MKNILSKPTLIKFYEQHPDSKKALLSWYATTKAADWKSLNDIKETFPFVSLLSDSRAVLNIKGNHYRIVVRINFNRQWVYIRFVGTHAEYDKIDANEI